MALTSLLLTGCEKTPANPNLAYVPPGSAPYTTKSGDDWWKLADRPDVKGKMDAPGLCKFNFQTSSAPEINWYLRNKAGCTQTTPDRKNYRFAGGEKIFLPASSTVVAPPPSNNPVVDVMLAGTAPHNLSKSDLNSTLNLGALTLRQTASVYAPIPLHPGAGGMTFPPIPSPLINHSTLSLELYFGQEALAASLASAGGRKLITDFFSNSVAKKEILYPEGSDVSMLVRDNPSFASSAKTFETDFTRRMRLVRTASGVAVNPATLRTELEKQGGSMTPPALPFFGIGSKLGILGSFQESRVRLTRLETPTPKSFNATLRYEVFDHFGCDDKDLEGLPTHGTPGQIAMWLLARDPKHAPGHKPFVVRIHVVRTVSDTQP